MRPMPNVLPDICLDIWLLAKFGPARLDGLSDGRFWERSVNSLLYRPGLSRRQGPGNVTLFGMPGASGVRHEIDGAAQYQGGAIVLECKARGVTKDDVSIFHVKTMDFYHRRVGAAFSEQWWRLLCGASGTTKAARATAVSLGLLICDPDRLPLPILVRAAGKPAADLHLPESLLQEIVRLGERALLSQQERWPYRKAVNQVGFQPDYWDARDIRDLLWLEDELSGCLLQLYEKHHPGVLEDRALRLIHFVRKAA